jgi:hypothetical protein
MQLGRQWFQQIYLWIRNEECSSSLIWQWIVIWT